MARKSNKTAHVLNLLSGQSTNEEPEKETEQPKEEDTEAKAEVKAEAKPEVKAEKVQADTAPAPAPAQASAPSPEVPANISIIDNAAKEDDPIAERIHEELLKELDPENIKTEDSSSPIMEESETEAVPSPVMIEPKAEAVPSSVTEEQKAETVPPSAMEEQKAETVSSSVTEESKGESTLSPVTGEPKAEAAILQDPEEESIELSSESTPEPEPPAEPEPDYVMLNVMQRVVEDKIIYFMKQFEVCTCDRCKADTIALTLSGLPAKYRIVDKHAVDPLISYYTNRLISHVTVEALKACTQVKDNPRH